MRRPCLRLVTFVVSTITICLFSAPSLIGAEDPPADSPPGPPVVNFKVLLGYLPAAPTGWTADKPEGNTMRLGQLEITTVSEKYAKGESSASIEIIDYSLQREMMKSMAMGWHFSNENAEGYQKSVTIDGAPGYETFTEADKTTDLYLIVGDRYWVHVEMKGEKPEVARAWLAKIDLKSLAAVK
jgi:hypothetical protein